MSTRNTVIRSLHDLGAAAWFGGSLMGAVGLNGASAAVRDPQDRARVASVGWAKWSPVNAAAIAAHLVGGGSILYENRRVPSTSPASRRTRSPRSSSPAPRSAPLQPAGSLGAKVAKGDGHPPMERPSRRRKRLTTSRRAQRQLRYLQWVLPVLDRNRRGSRGAAR